MSPTSFPLVIAPVVGFFLFWYATRPAAGSTAVAPIRLAAVRAALLTGAYAVLVVELLGALALLTAPAFAVAWLLFLTAAAAVARIRYRRDQPVRERPVTDQPVGERPAGERPLEDQPVRRVVRRAARFWRDAHLPERLLAGTVAALVLVEFVIALLAEPNNFDSQTYHLPKVEHWVAQGSLEFWPTAIHRQVTIPPGAEYLLLHLRLLTGGDALYNLVQWAAGVGVLAMVSRIVAQLGGGRRAQLLAMFLVATTPMVALQATSTQTDLVVAAWVGCVATLALDGLTRVTPVGSILALGVATGLTAITKTSGLLGAGPLLLLWGLAQLRLAVTGGPAQTGQRPGRVRAAQMAQTARTVGAGFGVLLVAAVLVGPFLIRVGAEFGHPLGPSRLRESIPMQRHDPPSVLVNGLRIGHTALDTPFGVVRDASAAAIRGLARVIGVDPQDRATTFGQTTWPVRSWYPDEDRVAFPLAGALALIGGALALARPRRVAPGRPAALRAYAIAVAAAVLLHVASIKWQPWGNRLLLYALVLALPLAALWLDALFRRDHDHDRDHDRDRPADEPAPPRAGTGTVLPAGRRSVATVAAVVVLATSALSGLLAISYGFPRRLVGTGSLLTTGDWETRFLRRPQWAEEFRWAATEVRASGARRIGLVQQNDNWEYPWWLLLGDDSREILALQSVLPDRPAADPASVDAIVCTGDRKVCDRLVPPGWRIEFRGYVGYALPPAG